MGGMLKKIRSEHNDRVEIAWRTANFIGAGSKLPPLQNFIIEVTPGKSLDKSPYNGSQVDPDAGLDAWFNMLSDLNGVK